MTAIAHWTSHKPFLSTSFLWTSSPDAAASCRFRGRFASTDTKVPWAFAQRIWFCFSFLLLPSTQKAYFCQPSTFSSSGAPPRLEACRIPSRQFFGRDSCRLGQAIGLFAWSICNLWCRWFMLIYNHGQVLPLFSILQDMLTPLPLFDSYNIQIQSDTDMNLKHQCKEIHDTTSHSMCAVKLVGGWWKTACHTIDQGMFGASGSGPLCKTWQRLQVSARVADRTTKL